MGILDTVIGYLSPYAGAAIPLAAGALDYLGASSANEQNRDIVQQQMQFQDRMSSTAYQRATQDMTKAGINPILAYSQGGASSPSGASMPMQNPMSHVVSSAIDAARTRLDLQNLQATNDKIKSDTTLNHALAGAAMSDSILKTNSARVADNNARLLEYKMPGASTEASIDQSGPGIYSRYLGRFTGAIGNLIAGSSAVSHSRNASANVSRALRIPVGR
jgi:hypothetical protein